MSTWCSECESTPQADMNRIARSISPATRSYRSPAREVSTNSWFHSCTRARSPIPVLVTARTRFIAADEFA